MTVQVGIAGLGTIGAKVAQRLVADPIPGLALTAVAVRDAAAARNKLAAMDAHAVAAVSAADLPGLTQVIVECVPAAAYDSVMRPALEAGRTVITVSCGALLSGPDYVDLARRHGGRIVVPSGAILGLDAIAAAAEGELRSVRLVTRKPPKSLKTAQSLVDRGLDVMALTDPVQVFSGTAAEAIRGFPANINVGVALSLAGLGPDRTLVEIWADPGVDRNTHRVEVEADSASFSMEIRNVPSEENPGTGRITPLSVIATLRRLVAPLAMG